MIQNISRDKSKRAHTPLVLLDTNKEMSLETNFFEESKTESLSHSIWFQKVRFIFSGSIRETEDFKSNWLTLLRYV